MNNYKIHIDGTEQLPEKTSTRNWTEINYSIFSLLITGVKKAIGIFKQKILKPAVDESSMAIRTDFLYEKHHRSYGRPWMLGKYNYEFLLRRGLKPSDTVLDFGCGAGRLGIWLIKYLEKDRYFGLDAHHRSLKAFGDYEIPFHDLADKHPQLLLNSKFNMQFFEKKFDWIVEVYVSHHIEESQLDLMYSNIAATLNKGGKYLVTPQPKISLEKLEAYGLKLNHKEKQILTNFQGQAFEDYNDWFEFVRV